MLGGFDLRRHCADGPHSLECVERELACSPIEDHFGGNPGAADPSLDDRDGLGIGSLRLRLRTTRSWILACTSAASLA